MGTGGEGVGGLAGISLGDITDSYATGSVEGSGAQGVGGLVGYYERGGISNSHATGSVTSSGSGTWGVGGLVGYGRYAITASYATGLVTGRVTVGGGETRSFGVGVGGLAGVIIDGGITDSHATGGVTGSVDGSGNGGVGGLVGYGGIFTNFWDSHATGDVTGSVEGSGAKGVGGLVGYQFRTWTRTSYATGSVTSSGSGTWGVGGLVGSSSSGDITDSYATGSVEGPGAKGVGGLVGSSSSGGITDSYATGSVEGPGAKGVGGLVGHNAGNIGASYATGSVTGGGEGFGDGGVGGLVGVNSSGEISQSYAIGMVSGIAPVGGLVGRNGGSISNSFWDTGTSGQPTGSGVGAGDSAGLLGRTTAQLQAPTGYTGIYRNWGDDVDRWDFGASSQYPVLKVDFDGNGNATWQEFGSQRGDIVTLPGAPTGLTATANGQTQIDLSWSSPASDGGAAITGYRIEVSADGSAWSDLDADTGSTTTSRSHTGLTAGTTRHYRVSAINSAGTGAASNVASATTTLGDSLIDRYDTNNNGMIEKNEVIKAINDYLFGAGDEAISKAEVIELINLYLFG